MNRPRVEKKMQEEVENRQHLNTHGPSENGSLLMTCVDSCYHRQDKTVFNSA